MISQYKSAVLFGDMKMLFDIKKQLCPQKLYRYRSFDAYWYSNIIKGKVYMNSPIHFNDPFDGNLYGYAKTFYREVSNSKGAIPSGDFSIINHKGEIKSFAEVLKSRQLGFKDLFRVACFSEKLDLLTMWAHYASNHMGYVIEYDLSRLTDAQMKNLYKIAYFSKDELEKADLIPQYSIFNLLRKDIEWSYEREWRMIKFRDSTDYEDLSQCISAVYLGLDFKKQYYQDELTIIQAHFKNTGADLREMYVSNDGYSLQSKLVCL